MTSATLTVDGIELLIDGAGPRTIVMIHGWPDTHRLWDSSVDALKQRFRCVRFTLPGFDLAAPARATSLMRMTALFDRIAEAVSPRQPVTLLLHDWGCVFGYEFAARHHARVAAIVAVDVGDHNSPALQRSLPLKARLQVFGYQFWLAVAWKLGGKIGDRMTRKMARATGCRTEPFRIGWQMNYPYAMKWLGSVGGFAALSQVEPHCPMLYCYGARKLFMFHSPEWLARLAARPGCSAQAFETGHWVMAQQPDSFNACVSDWLARIATSV